MVWYIYVFIFNKICFFYAAIIDGCLQSQIEPFGDYVYLIYMYLSALVEMGGTLSL